MTTRIRRRGLGLLVALVGATAALTVQARNPYATVVLSLLVPLLLAEVAGRAVAIARAVLWLATMPLPRGARKTWRQDLFASLTDAEDDRGPLDFAIDVAIGMPLVVWQERVTAFRVTIVFHDELPFRTRRAVTAAVATGCTAACVVSVATSFHPPPGLMLTCLGITIPLAAFNLGRARPEWAAEWMRPAIGILPLMSLYAATAAANVVATTVLAALVGAVVARIAARAEVDIAPPVVIAVAPTVLAGTATVTPWATLAAVMHIASLAFALCVAWPAMTGVIMPRVYRAATMCSFGLYVGSSVVPSWLSCVLVAAVALVIPERAFKSVVPPEPYDLGVARDARGDTAGAARAWQRAVAVDRRRGPEAAVLAGLAFADLGDVAGARSSYQYAIDSGDDSVTEAAAIGLGLLLRGRDTPAAVSAFGLAAEQRGPHAPAASLLLGFALVDCGDFAQARTAFTRAAASGDPHVASSAVLALSQIKGRRRPRTP